MRNPSEVSLATPRGAARVVVDSPTGQTNGTALLFHGAGGSTNQPVLVAVRDALVAAGWRVVRLDQPYVVAGRRSPAPAPHLDEVALLAAGEYRPDLLVGKSSGARVACRIAATARANGVVALGFPLHPPGRPERTRAPELNAAAVPVLVLQGERDAFGTPADVRAAAKRGIEVTAIPGDHAIRTRAAIEAAVAGTVAFAQART